MLLFGLYLIIYLENMVICDYIYSRMKLILPLSIDDGRIDWAIALINKIIEIGETKKELNLDWRRVSNISPAGLAILACILDTRIEQRARIKNVFIPRRFKEIPVIQNFEKEFSSLPPPSINNYESSGVLLKGAISLDVLFRERLEEKFSAVLSDELIFDVLLILGELMQNTIDHSTAERYYVYCGVWKNEFHAGLLDMGISIPAKMQQSYSCGNDLEYLKLALKEGTTTRRARTGGIGLTYFFDYLKRHEGKLTIVSRHAQIRRYFRTRRSQTNILKYPLRGTWCFARFPLGEKE